MAEKEKQKKRKVDVSKKFTLPEEVKRKNAFVKENPEEVFVVQERSPSSLRSEEIDTFEQLITQLPNEKGEIEQSQQLPSYEEKKTIY